MKRYMQSQSWLICVALLIITSTCCYPQVPSYVPKNGLKGWWPFNGNANDESGNGHHGNVIGAKLTTDRHGKSNASYYFDLFDFIQTPYKGVDGNKARSFSFWMKNQHGNRNVTALRYGGLGAPSSYGDEIQAKFNRNYLNDPCNCWPDVYEGAGMDAAHMQILYKTRVGDNQWHHYVYVIDSTTQLFKDVKIYRDGIIISMPNEVAFDYEHNSKSLAVNTVTSAEQPLLFGKSEASKSNVGSQLDSGPAEYLDDIGFWDRALSQEEIQSLYASQVAPDCESPARLDSVTINVKQNSTWSSHTLVPEKNYLLRGYGRWRSSSIGNLEEDFCYTYSQPCDSKESYRRSWIRVGFTLDSMLLDKGLLNPDQTAVDCENHMYTYSIVGNGQKLIVDFRDQPLTDNSGNLSFALYECSSCPINIPSDSILGYRNVETHQVVTYALRNNPVLSYKWIATGGYMLGASTNHFCDVIWGYDKNGSVCCIVSDSTCSDTVCVTTTINNKTTGGIAGGDVDLPTMSVKPNPAADMIDISTALGDKQAHFELVDVTGVVVQRVQGVYTRMSVSDVAPGVYHIVQRDALGNVLGMERVVIKR
jgi:hypothetical protein